MTYKPQPRFVAGVLFTFAALVFLLVTSAGILESAPLGWSVLTELIGMTIFLTGALALVAVVVRKEPLDWSTSAGPVLLALVGGALVRGGWGPWFALGLIVSTGLVTQVLGRGDRTEPVE